MRCPDCRDALGSYVDGELLPQEEQEVRDHIARCAECSQEYEALVSTIRTIKEGLVRHSAPDVLKARIRSSLAASNAEPRAAQSTRVKPVSRRWMQFAAAGIAIAVISSGLTVLATRSSSTADVAERALLDSHIRSLMSGHLIDVASSDQHNVKPWFNGRLDMSPTVPDLASAGFVLTGGRLDYVDKHPVAAVVYMRRGHVINVYSWPVARAADEGKRESTENGYHLIRWRTDGIELWAVSDLNVPELEQFVAAFVAASASR
jgi:anti-sigma factor RsiW